MLVVFALVLVAGCVFLFLPISLRLAVGWDEASTPPWKLSLRLWGIELMPSSRTRPKAVATTAAGEGPAKAKRRMPPWLRRLLRWAWKKFRAPRRRPSGRRTKGSLAKTILGLFLRFLKAAFVMPTRRIQLDLGGIDPATLASLWGLFLAFEPLLPRPGTLRFRPDWECFRLQGSLTWHLRSSVAGFLFGLLRSGRVRTPSLLPSRL